MCFTKRCTGAPITRERSISEINISERKCFRYSQYSGFYVQRGYVIRLKGTGIAVASKNPATNNTLT